MGNEFESKLLKAIKKLEGKDATVTVEGIISSSFQLERLEYILEDEILEVKDHRENYISIELDDIEKIYCESAENGYVLLELKLDSGIEIEIQTNGENVIFLKEKVIKEIAKSGILDQILKREVCGA